MAACNGGGCVCKDQPGNVRGVVLEDAMAPFYVKDSALYSVGNFMALVPGPRNLIVAGGRATGKSTILDIWLRDADFTEICRIAFEEKRGCFSDVPEACKLLVCEECPLNPVWDGFSVGGLVQTALRGDPVCVQVAGRPSRGFRSMPPMLGMISTSDPKTWIAGASRLYPRTAIIWQDIEFEEDTIVRELGKRCAFCRRRVRQRVVQALGLPFYF